MRIKRTYGIVVLGLSMFGCEPTDDTTDAAVNPAQPGCGQVGTFCAADASGPLDSAAPPITNPTSDAGGVTPLDAGGTRDGATINMDATVGVGTDGALGDAGVSTGDAQVDGATPAGDGGGTFPPVSDVSVKGPYMPMTVNSTGPDGNYTVFRPAELAPNGVLSPIVSWGNGGFTSPDFYTQLPHFASHGFVVVASNNSLAVSGAEVKAGIDWIVQQNETSGSPFYKKLDVKRIAGVGYSAGGLATLEVADDPRLLTIVVISGANTSESARTMNMPKLHTPVAYLCTDDDASKSNCAADFAVIKQPSFFGVMKGTGHVDVALGGDAVNLSATGTTAWLRWQVMGDSSYKSWFVGSDCKLCKDSAWTVQQKNLQ